MTRSEYSALAHIDEARQTVWRGVHVPALEGRAGDGFVVSEIKRNNFAFTADLIESIRKLSERDCCGCSSLGVIPSGVL